MAKQVRIDEKTPCGGDYSVISYLDKDHNLVDESEATEFIIEECRKDGIVIVSTMGLLSNQAGD